jgi:serine phosphatase RsbU (regulator of sigma subunit)
MKLQDDAHHKEQSSQHNSLLTQVLAVEKGTLAQRQEQITSGDRFLLYTDGLIEPENTNGESFGDRRLEEVVRENQRRPCAEMSDRLLSELRQWQPSSAPQQDDITLIVIDVL